MANVITPVCLLDFLYDPDGKRKKTYVFLLVRMADTRKPLFFCSLFGFLRMANVIKPMNCPAQMANAIQPMFVFLIRMANAIKPMCCVIIRMASATKPMFLLLSTWQAQ